MTGFKAVVAAELEAAGKLLVQDGNHGEYRPRPSEFSDVGTSFIRAADMANGRLLFDKAERINETALQRIRKGIGKPQDVILSHKGTVGKVAFADADCEPFVCSPQTTFWRSLDHEVIDPRYLFFAIRSPGFISQLRTIENETDMAAYVPLTQQRRLQLSVPPIAEQRKIASILGVLDDKIAVNDRIARTIDDLSNALFEEATILCPRVSLADTANPVLGATPDRTVSHYWGGTVPWASAKDVANSSFGVIATTEERITEDAAQTTRAKPVPPGSVVLTARGTVGAVARVINLSSFNQSCYAFTPGQIPPGVLFHLIRAASDRMLNIAHGTVFSTVNMKTFSHVAVPSISDAQLPALEGKLAPLHRGIEHRLLESMTLRNLRDTLLPELMSGRLRMRDVEKIVEETV